MKSFWFMSIGMLLLLLIISIHLLRHEVGHRKEPLPRNPLIGGTQLSRDEDPRGQFYTMTITTDERLWRFSLLVYDSTFASDICEACELDFQIARVNAWNKPQKPYHSGEFRR